MSNPSKRKGTAGETAAAKWFRANGFPFADRQPLRGNRDAGDLALAPGLVAEVKSVAVAAGGRVPPKMLATFMAEAESERMNAGAAHCPLIVKRAGTADVAQWFAYLPAWAFAQLVGAIHADAAAGIGLPDPHAPLCTDVGTLARLLRYAGFGEPLEEVAS